MINTVYIENDSLDVVPYDSTTSENGLASQELNTI